MTSFLCPLSRNLSLYRGPHWVRPSQRRSYLGSVTYPIQVVSTLHFYLKHDMLGVISEHSKSGEPSLSGSNSQVNWQSNLLMVSSSKYDVPVSVTKKQQPKQTEINFPWFYAMYKLVIKTFLTVMKL